MLEVERQIAWWWWRLLWSSELFGERIVAVNSFVVALDNAHWRIDDEKRPMCAQSKFGFQFVESAVKIRGFRVSQQKSVAIYQFSSTN